MCIVGNPIILHCQIISFPPKKEKENGIMEFLNLFIYIYSKNPLWLRIISQVKRRFSKVVKLYLLWSKKKSLWNSDRTSDEVNQKPFTKTILLTSKTDIYKKLSEPCEPPFNLTDLKITDGCHDSRRFSWFRVFFFFLVLSGSAIDEASTSNIEIAPLFVLILLFNLARLLSLRFCRLLFCIFSFSAFHLLFLQFSSSCIFPLNSRVFWLFEDDWQTIFCHPLNSCCQPLFFKFY